MKIYYPKNGYEHKYSIILLHSLYYDHRCFKQLVEKIRELPDIGIYIKFIIPDAPKRDIDWSEGRETNVRSWYNYFTCRDGELEHDDIDQQQYWEQCARIVSIIKSEATIIDSQNIIVMGESQGGTIAAGVATMLNDHKNQDQDKDQDKDIGGFIICDSVFMDNVLMDNMLMDNVLSGNIDTHISSAIYIYSSELDEIYTLQLQNESIIRLNLEPRIKDWYIDMGITHSQTGDNRDPCILSWIQEIYKTR